MRRTSTSPATRPLSKPWSGLDISCRGTLPRSESCKPSWTACWRVGSRPSTICRRCRTRMVIEETMRLFPPAHTFVRQALTADKLAGRSISKGSLVLIVPWVLHRHRRLWDRPDAFDPERFAPERAASRHPFAYVPFGGGPRICLGASFGMMEAVLVLAGLAQHYRLHLAPGQRIAPLASVTLRPRYGMTMILERRV